MMVGMAKEKMTVSVDPGVLADITADARAMKMTRSEFVERILRDAHYAGLLAKAAPAPLPEAEADQLRELLVWQRDPSLAS